MQSAIRRFANTLLICFLCSVLVLSPSTLLYVPSQPQQIVTVHAMPQASALENSRCANAHHFQVLAPMSIRATAPPNEHTDLFS